MKYITILLAFLVMLSSSVAAQQSTLANAHIKCFANMTRYLFTVEMRKENPVLEQQRQRHEELSVEIGRKELNGSNFKFGVDYHLGSVREMVWGYQDIKLNCDDADAKSCDYEDWATHSVEEMSAIALKFYKRENCKLLLK
ncbi:hypothetical protein N9O40_00850 [Planktomarina sp.]|nr:hypothetical protein [Planktomarina sp.]